jgi:Gpi18-like mannosyltransferase
MRFKIERLLLFLLITRILILVLPWLTINLLFPENAPQNFINFTQNAWVRWDAPHYLYLAQYWYTNVGDEANFIVFFPLYPSLLKLFIYPFINPAISAITISITLFISGCYFFYKLVEIDYGEITARWSVIALAIFPTAYFFNAPYTESLFLLLFSASLYSARKEKWIPAGILTGLGCVSRPFGMLLLPAILIEWLMSKKRNWKTLPVIIIPSIVAVLGYLYLNKYIYGSYFAFQKILALNWHKHLLSPFISIGDSWRVAFSGGLTNFVILVGWAEAITITLAWVLIPFVFKFLRKSWAVYYALSIILFSSTSFILSTPRYLLSIPPFFVLIALAQKNQSFKLIWRFASIALLFCLSILFTRGQWAF